MKIYTKTGDDGYTSLLSGTRVPKHHLRIEAYGTVDELNAYIGLIADQPIGDIHTVHLREVQDKLFVMGSMLATDPNKPVAKIPELYDADIEGMEKHIDDMDTLLPELRHFILPGGNNAISYCHVARCVCRRAERLAVHLAEQSYIDVKVLIYLNRLSDYLFTLARMIGHEQKVAERMWLPRKEK